MVTVGRLILRCKEWLKKAPSMSGIRYGPVAQQVPEQVLDKSEKATGTSKSKEQKKRRQGAQGAQGRLCLASGREQCGSVCD